MPPYEPDEIAWLLFYATFDLTVAQIATICNRRFELLVVRSPDALRQQLGQIRKRNNLGDGHGTFNQERLRQYLAWYILENNITGIDIDRALSNEEQEALNGTRIWNSFEGTTDGG